jgi:hypothetical protein
VGSITCRLRRYAEDAWRAARNGANNLSGTLINTVNGGLGAPSPSLVTILRRTPGCGQIPIRVSLNRALRDPRERILVQPGDTVLLQETTCEAITRYFTTNFRYNFFGTISRQRGLTATTTLIGP